MAKRPPAKDSCYMMVDGVAIPMTTIDYATDPPTITYHMSYEDRDMYTKKMLKNVGEIMSSYYSQHPERFK